MGKDDDRRRGWLPLEIIRQPRELLVAERAQCRRFQISNSDEPDEVHAAIVKEYQPMPCVFLPKRSR